MEQPSAVRKGFIKGQVFHRESHVLQIHTLGIWFVEDRFDGPLMTLFLISQLAHMNYCEEVREDRTYRNRVFYFARCFALNSA